jgi:diguanylate cyclase (GGDEF)-like protein/PAS domain S-box-containing protein
MNIPGPADAVAAGEDLAALVHTLVEAERRIRELTAGEVDAVIDEDGRTFLLQHAQEWSRYRECLRKVAVLNSLPASIAVLDPQGQILSTNDAWRHFADHNAAAAQSPGACIGVNYLAVCDDASGEGSADARRAAAGIRSVIRGESDRFVLEYPCHAPAQKRWFLMEVAPLADGSATGAIVLHLDITDRVLAEIALGQSMEEFRSLAESMPQIVWATGPEGGTTYFNRRWMDYTGLTLKESLGDGWNKPFHPDDRESAWAAWLQAVANAGEYSVECRLRRADGAYRWWLVRGSPFKNAQGEILKWYGTCTDIHDLKASNVEVERANASLTESAKRISYLNRLLSMLSSVNQLIVHTCDRDELFRAACGIAVEHGGFNTVIVGLLDPGSNRLVPVASAGDEATLAIVGKALASEEAASTSVMARAVREKTPCVADHIERDERVPLRAEYLAAGIRSKAAFPIIVDGSVIGAFVLFANEADFFQPEELALLAEVSDDIAFAVDHIHKSEKLNYLAYYDELTGLANQTLFLQRAGQGLQNAAAGVHGAAMVMVDLERFKSINDSFGRPVGDELLRHVGAWLSANLADATLLARVGADHFAMMLPEAHQPGQAARELEELIARFNGHPFLLGETAFRVSAKFGVAVFPDDGTDADTLFRHAEAALKKAKASGDRYLFYTQKMTEAVARKLTLENQLRQALEREEFVLHYQPKVSLQSGRMTGAEALIRWQDPRTGLVPPGVFIPVLEETGLINEVGRWVLRKALADYVRWTGCGLFPGRIAVNASPLQLRRPGFLAELEQILASDGRAAGGLELEITESMIMEDIRLSIRSLQAIRDFGIPIAIDDFGTGFSSLGYLSKLPVDTLKIDRSFVNDMTQSPDGLSLVSTMITLGHSLELKIVAEGVETEEQRNLLRLLKCDEMQGYFFSKPLPADVFEARFLRPAPGDPAPDGRTRDGVTPPVL